MSLRSMIPFLMLVFVVAAGGAFVGLRLLPSNQPESIVELVTVEVIITATTDPNLQSAVTVVTATPDRTQVALPPDLLPERTSDTSSDPDGAPTLDPARLGADAAAIAGDASAGVPTQLPDNCIIHVVQEGDFPSSIAEEYDADLFLMLSINNLDEESARFLQIGDELIVPLEGCAIPTLPPPTATLDPNITPSATPTATATPVMTNTPTITPTVTPTPTITLEPTAANSQLELVSLTNPGDITAEVIRIRNAGNTVDATGWTLQNENTDESYTFNDLFIFSETTIALYSGTGEPTPIVLFWGRDRAIWGNPNHVITLRDAQGQVQATSRVGDLVATP